MLMVFFLIYSGTGKTQTVIWEKNLGNTDSEGAQAMVITSDGGIVMTGYIEPNGIREVLIMKTDSEGNLLWMNSFLSNIDNNRGVATIGFDIQQTFDKGFIISGRTVGEAAILIKTDSLGNLQWEREYNYPTGEDSRGHAVWQTLDSGYVVAGQTWIMHGSFFNYDFFLMKTDKSGNVEWMKVYFPEEAGNDVALGVEQLPDGGYILAGVTQSSQWASYVVRTDSHGNLLWSRMYPGPWQSEAYDIQRLPDGGYIMTGTETDFDTDSDVMLTKLDSSGNVVWKKIYGGTTSEYANSVYQLSDGFLLSGVTTMVHYSWNMYVLRTDLSGDTLWTQIIAREGDDRGFDAAKAPNGFIYSAGWTYNSFNGHGDILLVKLSDNSVGINNISSVAEEYNLYQNYPNPFNPSTKIKFSIPVSSNVSLKLYDAAGRFIMNLVNGFYSAGIYEIDLSGEELSSGTYFYTLESKNFRQTRKMVVLK